MQKRIVEAKLHNNNRNNKTELWNSFNIKHWGVNVTKQKESKTTTKKIKSFR